MEGHAGRDTLSTDGETDQLSDEIVRKQLVQEHSLMIETEGNFDCNNHSLQ